MEYIGLRALRMVDAITSYIVLFLLLFVAHGCLHESVQLVLEVNFLVRHRTKRCPLIGTTAPDSYTHAHCVQSTGLHQMT